MQAYNLVSRWHIFILVIIVMFSLQGCYFNRVMKTKNQLCKDDPPKVYFDKKGLNNISIKFSNPMLLEEDVVSIIGAEPTSKLLLHGSKVLTYKAVSRNNIMDVSSELEMKVILSDLNNGYRVSRIDLPSNLNAIIPIELLKKSIICKPDLHFLPPSVVFNLNEIDKGVFPTLNEITQVLGKSKTYQTSTNFITYEYCLVPCSNEPSNIAMFEFSFSDYGVLEKVNAQYFRYKASIDLNSVNPTASIILN